MENLEDKSVDAASELFRKYQKVLIDKLTRSDLEELRFYLQNQFDEQRRFNAEYRLKFESKLRQYLHEDVLRREIAGIEALLAKLRPEDLKE